MAIYHLSLKSISRASGRTAIGAAAYRSGSELVDLRTGEIHDYRRKAGVLSSAILIPGGGTIERSDFWNAVEFHHKRKDAVVAREVVVSLPPELDAAGRELLALSYARELADRYRVGVDIALHAARTIESKNPDEQAHNGNWHAHIMLTGCYMDASGTLGKKAVELDPIHCQRAKIENMAEHERPIWESLVNQALEKANVAARVDHRSHEARGIAALPSKHLGPAAAGIERKTKAKSRRRLAQEQAALILKKQIELEVLKLPIEVIESIEPEVIQASTVLTIAEAQAVSDYLGRESLETAGQTIEREAQERSENGSHSWVETEKINGHQVATDGWWPRLKAHVIEFWKRLDLVPDSENEDRPSI
jgi:hypothetical protein